MSSFRVDIMTLFPDTMQALLGESILGRAAKKDILDIHCVQIRDYTTNRQMQVDDYPYGGGFGCVLMAQPLKSCLDDIVARAGERRRRVIYMSPQGKTLTQETARRLVRDYDHLVLVCGHYEGIDERFIEACVDEEISIGDYVLTGGELPAMVLTDCVCRMVPGVLADEACYTGESHWDGLLEYPQYTRPAVWEGRRVPDVLVCGNHAEVERWRTRKQLERTLDKRPDMAERLDPALFAEILLERAPKPKQWRFDCRRAEPADLSRIMRIVEEGRASLAELGIEQWQSDYPTWDNYEFDIARGIAWIVTSGQEIAAVTAIDFTPDAAYADIKGAWLTDGAYASIHRTCVDRAFRGTGAGSELLSLAEDLALGSGCGSVRVDTHEGNTPMRRLLEKNGYIACGVITLLSGSEAGQSRVAYEKKLV